MHKGEEPFGWKIKLHGKETYEYYKRDWKQTKSLKNRGNTVSHVGAAAKL